MKKKSNFLILVAIFILATSSLCFAAAKINLVSGEIAHNQAVTIYGTGFGTKANSSPMRYENFENGTVGTRILPESEGGFSTSATYSGYQASYNNEVTRRPNTQSMYQNFTDGNYNGYVQLTKTTLGNSTKKIYFSGWFYLVTGGAESRNTKILNMGTDSGWQTRLDVYPTNGSGHLYATTSCSGSGYLQDWGTSTNIALKDDGHWHRLEGWLDLGSPNGGNGYRDVWMDLEKIGSLSGSFIDGDCSLSYVLIGHYFATDTGTPTPWAKRYWDEIYVDTTRARVEIGDKENWNDCTHREIQIPTNWANDRITLTVNQGTFQNNQAAYVFVVDSEGTVSPGAQITFGEEGGSGSTTPTDSPPSVNIASPTSNATYASSTDLIEISGNAQDDTALTNITWANNRGGSGTATNTAGDWSNFTIARIDLQDGENIITITATDNAGQQASDTLIVTYTSSSTLEAWSAIQQTGDYSWTNSSVTYCVRLLIEGAEISRSGSQVMVGFQGRSSGSYAIKKVSIAERNASGDDGDAVDSTWTQVTFNGSDVSTWENDLVTVDAGAEKLSDVIPFNIQPGKDYYVTFKIESPSVYLDPPSYYQELYFSSEDRASDIDWTSNGFSTTADYHALSKIYVLEDGSNDGSNDSTTPPSTPPSLRISMN